MVIIIKEEVEVNICFHMNINAKAWIHTLQKLREITHWSYGISLAFTLSLGPEGSVETEPKNFTQVL